MGLAVLEDIMDFVLLKIFERFFVLFYLFDVALLAVLVKEFLIQENIFTKDNLK